MLAATAFQNDSMRLSLWLGLRISLGPHSRSAKGRGRHAPAASVTSARHGRWSLKRK